MKNVTIFLVQLSDALREAAIKAAKGVFPGAEFVTARTVAEAGQRNAAARELLLLGGADESEAALAAEATDAGNLPRWAAVILGGSSSDLLDCVPPEECKPRMLARVFRSAVLQHELLRENLQLRGDLRTVARRVSHDLFTPLNCIHLTCETLGDLPPGDAAALKAKAGAIRDMLAETCRLINRVSFVLTASSHAPPASAVSMDGVVESVLQQLDSEIRQAGATVRQPANWPEATGVEPWLEVIWWNLIVNALKHGSSSLPIELGWSRQGDGARFWVANRGAAVPAGLQARFFQPFERLHTAPAPGLGLSLVRRLVSLQGGDCGYERRDDDASVFYFTLPVPA